MRAPTPLLPLLLAVAAAAIACGAGIPQTLPAPPDSEAVRETYARRMLLDARALRREGRLEAAARVAARGLELSPDNAALHRLRAEVLETLGHPDQAAAHRRVLALLDPPPPPLPQEPLDLSSRDVLVVLLAPPEDPGLVERVPQDWPHGEVAAELEERLRVRLPDATVHHGGVGSVEEAQRWLERQGFRAVLSLRVDRAFCLETLKDGFFSAAWLRAAAARPGGDEPFVREVREVLTPPADRDGCRREAVARALERVLGEPELRAALAGEKDASGVLASRSARALFPGLGVLIATQIDAGRTQLSAGDLAAAVAHFRAAAAIDPEDLDARSFLDDTERALALSRQLTPVSSPAPGATAPLAPGALVPDLSSDRRLQLEQLLEEEKRRRDDLLATLAVLDEDRLAPSPATVAALRPAHIRDPDAVGPRLARAGRDRPVEARVMYAPDGRELARYYFSPGSDAPLLREEDSDEDGRADRWVAYAGGARREVWEDRRGAGAPDLHLVFAQGGDPLERLEVDTDADGTRDRVFHYVDGRLVAEERDTNGNGRFDLVERFDESGSLTLREEDVNGDGAMDVRTAFRSGRIVRREIVNPEVLPQIQ